MIREATSADALKLARLASEIWTEHYQPIIGLDQVEYMLDRFQSERAISEQLDTQGYRYFFIEGGHQAVGYIGVQPEGDALFLSKLYVANKHRKNGYGREAIDFVFKLAAETGCARVRLTVNRNNRVAIAAYERTGFTRTGEVIADIGGGYVMDDYAFEKTV